MAPERRVRSADTGPAVGGDDVGVASSLPSSGARLLAFGAVVVAGLCGGLIGYGVADLSCTGGCGSTTAGVGAVIGAALAAGGVAVIAVLVLRAMAEWRTIEATKDTPGGRPAR